MVAGLSTRNYRRAVESVLEGYGIEKSSVSRQFVAASSNQLRVLCERRLEDLNLVVLTIDGIHFGPGAGGDSKSTVGVKFIDLPTKHANNTNVDFLKESRRIRTTNCAI